MTDVTDPKSFAAGISLDPSWPKTEPKNLSIAAHTRFAASYLEAAERAFFHEDSVIHATEHYMGPNIQLTGLAAELTFKTLLLGNGYTDKKIRAFGHSTYKAYYDARLLFDEVAFVGMVATNCDNLIPKNAQRRLNEYCGGKKPDGWSIIIPQLKALDSVYDRPFRSRYHSAGKIILPETFVVIVGVKTLLAAMLERVGDDRLPGSLLALPDPGQKA